MRRQESYVAGLQRAYSRGRAAGDDLPNPYARPDYKLSWEQGHADGREAQYAQLKADRAREAALK
jgi:hypothetical protein